ncbi:MAG: LamB/YcsF family protein [Candidatus Puniceispirillaceae bacterium]
MKFNLNADMAEGYGPWKMGDDDALLTIIATANIACGFHAGDHNIMGKTMAQAQKGGVSLGAHPGFLDLHGFGRRQMTLSLAEIERLMAYQIGASLGMAALVGAKISHVKPHGALNNMACADADMSGAIVRAIKSVDQSLILLSPALSELSHMGHKAGLPVAEEVFADRAYMPDGQLAPRSRSDAMIHDEKLSVQQCLSIFQDGKVRTVDGQMISLPAQSICVHGDGPNALSVARAVRQGMAEAGFQLVTLPQMMA